MDFHKSLARFSPDYLLFFRVFDDVVLHGEVMNLMSLDASFSSDYESMFRFCRRLFFSPDFD